MRCWQTSWWSQRFCARWLLWIIHIWPWTSFDGWLKSSMWMRCGNNTFVDRCWVPYGFPCAAFKLLDACLNLWPLELWVFCLAPLKEFIYMFISFLTKIAGLLESRNHEAQGGLPKIRLGQRWLFGHGRTPQSHGLVGLCHHPRGEVLYLKEKSKDPQPYVKI